MRDSDDLTDIPPIVPTRDDVATHRQARRGQAQDIVRPAYRVETEKVSTWPVRIMLAVLSLAIIGGGAGAYYFYGLYRDDLRLADLRISDLERKLALVGDSAEDSVVNIQETLDFHFSEIDKLWAARNTTNKNVDDVKSEIAKLGLVNEGQDEVVNNLAQQVTGTTSQLDAANTRVNSLTNELAQLTQSVSAMNASLDGLQSLRADMQTVQNALNSGDSTVVGLIGRLEYVEQSMESVNAHRLQINETLFRLQENLEALQRQLGPPGL